MDRFTGNKNIATVSVLRYNDEKHGENMITREQAPEYLRLAGEALYGSRWQTDLSRALGLSDAARLRQWLSLARPVPPGVWNDILAIMAAHQKRIAAATKTLEEKKRDLEEKKEDLA